MSQECVVVVCLFDWCLTARQQEGQFVPTVGG